MGRWMKTIYFWCVFYLEMVTFFDETTAAQNGSQCGGYCTDDVEKCKNRGGRIMGFCTNALACCDPLIHSAAKCGDVKRGQRIVDFKSPEFPTFSSGDLTCLVKIDILKDNVATRIDFIQANMEGPAFSEGDNESGQCEADMIFLRGFETWAPPPRCGNLSGYSFLIDRDTPQAKGMTSLSILALMASPSYRWHIRVVQLVKTKSTSSKDKQNSVYHSTPPAHDETPVFNKGKRSLSDQDFESKLSGEAGPNWRMILNGEETHISRVPWQVSFRYKSESLSGEEVKETENKGCSPGEGSHFCGGSIIADQFILTASHCFYGTSKTSDMLHLPLVKAVVGDTNLCTDDAPTSADHDVESVTMHYAYDGSVLINDIAVVKLKTKIRFKDHVTPVLLAATGDDFSEQEALLSGWGDYLRPVSPEKKKKNDTMDDDEEAEEEENETDLPTSTEVTTTSSTTTTAAPPPAFTIEVATTTITPPPTFTTTTTSTPTAATTTTPVETTTDFDYENITVSPPSSTTPPPPPPPTTPLTEPPSSSSLPTVSPVLLDPVTQFELDTPTILQASKRFIIQNRTVCNARDLLQYSAVSAASVEQYAKYQGVFNSTLCTLGAMTKNGERPVSTGKGDSGGALVVYVDQIPHVVGVVSYGVSESAEQEICNPGGNNGTFDYFSSVAFFRGWIDLVVLSHQNYSHVA